MLMTIAGLTTLMAQQTHDIKGVVTDKRNEPIVGALVTAEGTDISSITDIDGKFLLRDVPVDAKKVLSMQKKHGFTVSGTSQTFLLPS